MQIINVYHFWQKSSIYNFKIVLYIVYYGVFGYMPHSGESTTYFDIV